MARLFSYQTAALLSAISALLHLSVIPFAASESLVPLLVSATIIGFLAIGLFRGWRWIAYLAFIALLIGMLVAFALSYGSGAFPPLLHTINALASLAAVIILLVLLWQPRTAAI